LPQGVDQPGVALHSDGYYGYHMEGLSLTNPLVY